MGAQQVKTAPAPIRFQRNLSLLSGAGSAGITLNAAGDFLTALLSESAPFPPGDIELAEIRLRAETPKPIEFGRGDAKVRFAANGGAFAGLGIYQNPVKLLAKLASDDTILPGIRLTDGETRDLAVLRWGYDAHVNANGSMALGAAVRASLAVDGAGEGLFAIIRSVDRSRPARQIVQLLVDSWILPKQVRDVSQIEPGTWLITEVDGSVGISLGVQAGYKFNWVREAWHNGLQGDIGLRIESAIAANVGFRAQGKWAVVVARENSDPVLRVRIFRLKARQLNLAANASAVFQPVTKILPQKADDLVQSVFGAHGSQLLADIAVVEKWTDPSNKLTELLAAEGMKQARGLIAHVAGVPADQLDDKYEEVHGRVVKLIQAWRGLDHRLAATALKLVEERIDLTEVRATLHKLKTISGEALRLLLTESLGANDFMITPAGRLLESLAGAGVFSLLNMPLAGVQQTASRALELLDGSTVEEALGRFQQYVESRLNVGAVMKTVSETDFEKLDGLLKQKLAEFLGESSIDFSRLEKIRTAVRLVLNKRQEWYEAALRALERSYNAELTASYQKAVGDAAHFDISFDFRHDPQGVSSLLQAALSGDFDKVLTTQHRDVRLGLGQLTHGVRRRSHVELTLPFLHFEGTHLNEALATVDAVDDDGRVFVYRLDAQDIVATNRRNSTLAVALSLASKSGRLRVHEASGFDYSYTLRQAGKRVTRQELGPQLVPIFSHFPDAPSIDKFLDFFDRRTEEALPNTPEFLGNILLELRLNFSADDARMIGDAWTRVRQDKILAYEPMSLAIQRTLRRIILDCYFQDADRYSDYQIAQLLLCWACMPPANQVLEDGKTRPKQPKDIIWDAASRDLRRKRLQLPETRVLLDRRLREIHTRLQKTPGMRSLADRYHWEENGKIRKRLVDNPGNLLFEGLLLGESAWVHQAWEAGQAISNFMQAQPDRPSLAIQCLEEFGSRITGAFNQEVAGVFLGGVSRALGTAIFIEATQALSDVPIDVRQNAMLSINALKNDFTFNPRHFLDTGEIPADKIAVREQMASIS